MGVLNVRVLPGGPWIPITGVGVGTGITPADADARYVNVTGDSMTGPLTITGSNPMGGGTQLILNNPTVGLEGGQISLLLGDDWGRAWNLDVYNNTMRMHNGTNTPFAASASAVTITGTLNMEGNGIGPYWPNWGGGWYMQDAAWVRAAGDKGIYTGGTIACNGSMSIGANGAVAGGYRFDTRGRGYFSGGMDADGTIRGVSAGNEWNTCSVIAMTGSGRDRGTVGTLGGGAAHCQGSVNGQGWYFFWNSNQTAYSDCIANQFYQNSERRNKQDIEPWPAPAPASAGAVGHAVGAVDRLRGVEIITYRQRRDLALLDTHTDERGIREHFCDEGDCGGTTAEPCGRVKHWEQVRLGVTVEQLAEHVPEMVGYDGITGEPCAVSSMGGVAALIAAVQELDQRIHDLENT